jgi:nicotine blue oxidoreductase
MPERDTRAVKAAGVLLAAGAGTRFGMPKVLAAHGSWLSCAISALVDGGCAEVIVVLGAAVIDIPPPARAVVASDWRRGPGASLLAGLDSVTSADYLVIHTVDTPDIGAAVVERVLRSATESVAGIARAYYGSRPGHPVVVARQHWPALRQAISTGRGAKEFLAGRDDVFRVNCADLATGLDIDSPVDPQIQRRSGESSN